MAGLPLLAARFFERVSLLTYEAVFVGTVDEISRRRASPFSATLVGPEIEAGASDEAMNRENGRPVRFMRGRSLRYAVLAGANLRRVDFTGSDLTAADLREAQLQRARLANAQLHGADLREAQLQGASLLSAKLQDADLSSAGLQHAYFEGAQLRGADLSNAELQGGDLSNAELQGTNLRKAQLQGADLSDAQLQGADLSEAQLQGAYLFGAKLQAADLSSAELQHAYFNFAQLQGAELLSAQLQGTDLTNANLKRAVGPVNDATRAALMDAEVNCDPLPATEIADYERALEGTDARIVRARDRLREAGKKVSPRCLNEEAWRDKGTDIVNGKEETIKYFSDGRFAERLSRLRDQACNAKTTEERDGVVRTAALMIENEFFSGYFSNAEINEAKIPKQASDFAAAILDETQCPNAAALPDDLKRRLRTFMSDMTSARAGVDG
jgi:uncharacterized protein YjbI with pentapeptide repeats